VKSTIYPEITISKEEALLLNDFKAMDYYALEHYNLPIALMMENAGLHLARVISSNATVSNTIQIGIGNGNNGGGGLVAARRLAGWGYKVYLDIPSPITKELPKKQLDRALSFGVTMTTIANPDVWVDAYLGFSQRLPLNEILLQRIDDANQSSAKKIALDIPTGFLGDATLPYFKADTVLTLAASKKILYTLPLTTDILIADLGIPKSVYQKFNIEYLPFYESAILKLLHS